MFSVLFFIFVLTLHCTSGEYAMVLSLIRLMEDGKEIKTDVDFCIDHCGLLHNIRETIFLIREQAETSRTALDTQVHSTVCFHENSPRF
jgi:hypothetical protein